MRSMRSHKSTAWTAYLSGPATCPLRWVTSGTQAIRKFSRSSAICLIVRANGKPSGILAPAEADARHYIEWVCTFTAVGSDLGAFRTATQSLRDKFRN